MEPKIIPVTSLRPKLLKCLKRANQLGEEFVITKNGKPSAVIVSFEEWESWKETREILARPAVLKRIRKSKTFFGRGRKGKTIREVFDK